MPLYVLTMHFQFRVIQLAFLGLLLSILYTFARGRIIKSYLGWFLVTWDTPPPGCDVVVCQLFHWSSSKLSPVVIWRSGYFTWGLEILNWLTAVAWVYLCSYRKLCLLTALPGLQERALLSSLTANNLKILRRVLLVSHPPPCWMCGYGFKQQK